VTLTNLLPAESGTNLTIFVHTNRVDFPTGQIFGMMMSGGGGDSLLGSESEQKDSKPTGPAVVPKDGSRAPMPLEIYPPGLDLSGYIIIWPDGSTDEWSAKLVEQWRLIQQEEQNGPEPEDAGGESPGTGFYQVVKDGVRIWGVTNVANPMVLSGTVIIPFEAGNADPNSTNLIGTLNSAILLVDGLKFRGDASLDAPPAYPWQFTVDTAYLENGDHTIQIETFWFDLGGATDGTESLFPSRVSDPVTITVSNAIYYPQWEDDIGEVATNAAYFLKTPFTNVNWSIDIYDTSSNFVQRLTGHTDDGIIEADWNLMDTNGVARTNAEVDAEFGAVAAVEAPSGTVTKKTPPKKNPKSDWPEHGKWTVAYLDYFKHYYSANGDMQGHINEFALTAGKFGGYLLYYPPSGSTNDIGQTYPLRYYDTNHPSEGVTATMIAKDSTKLKSFLSDTNSRNFFYRGHAGPRQIGYTTSSEIGKVVKHRYRFVLLQGCNTADGDLDKAFGIAGPAQVDLPEYQKSGRRPATFLGSHGKSRFANGGVEVINGVPYDGRIPWQVPYLYYNFLFYWDTDLVGWDVFSSIGQAILDLPAISGWSYDDHPGRRLKLYGYPFLHIDEFNYKTSWP
jgi:hypothetical protein